MFTSTVLQDTKPQIILLFKKKKNYAELLYLGLNNNIMYSICKYSVQALLNKHMEFSKLRFLPPQNKMLSFSFYLLLLGFIMYQ